VLHTDNAPQQLQSAPTTKHAQYFISVHYLLRYLSIYYSHNSTYLCQAGSADTFSSLFPPSLVIYTIKTRRLSEMEVGVAGRAWSTHAAVLPSLLPAVEVRTFTHAHVSMITYRVDV